MTSFPDYKSTFPKWRREPMSKLVPTLDEDGLDLLEQLLEFDPARRLSAKAACRHEYFIGGASMYSQRGVGVTSNGFH